MTQKAILSRLATLTAVLGAIASLSACQTLDFGNLFGTRPAVKPPAASSTASGGPVAAATVPSGAVPAKPLAPVRPILVQEFKRNGFACCNLHYSGEVISDANLAQLPFIPLGTPIKVSRFEGNRALVEIGGKPMQLGMESVKTRETMEQWVSKLVVLDDPRPRLARYEPSVRAAIAGGQVQDGMTREQVLLALGYPPPDENPTLDAPYWRYWWSGTAPFYVYWSKSGSTVIKIDARAGTLARVIYRGK